MEQRSFPNTDAESAARHALRAAWLAVDPRATQSTVAADLAQLQWQVSARSLPSVYDVTALAAASIGVATLAVAQYLEQLGDGVRRTVTIDGQHAAAAFQLERLLTPLGWELPPVWDPLAGDYRTADGFVRLHTNYAHHRAAALAALNVPADREAVARAVLGRRAEDVEQAVVAAGGCAAALRTEADWAVHPAGRALAAQPLLSATVLRESSLAMPLRLQPSAARPLAGVRVLDMTRVIAGPVGTRFLAGYGADVLRIDPPGFEEVPALLPEMTAGKRCASLDLRRAADRQCFDALLASADVLVCGLRESALPALGYTTEALGTLNPTLLIARVNAYGNRGPWRERRGFDSLVQMSTGIAERGMHAAGADKPIPLPVQALDHATGYLLAAAVVCALTRRTREGVVSERQLSLARTSLFLRELGVSETFVGEAARVDDFSAYFERAETTWGPVRRLRQPGAIEGVRAHWSHAPGLLGSAAPSWT